MDFSVQCVILNEQGLVLGVSRKNDHKDFGLVGGKVDLPDYLCDFDGISFESVYHTAMYREAFEETGLVLDMSTAEIVFQMCKDGYNGITYLIKDWSGEINHDEPHLVKWVPFSKLFEGSFGKWNSLVSLSLDNLGVNHIKYLYANIEQKYGKVYGELKTPKDLEELEELGDVFTFGEIRDTKTLIQNMWDCRVKEILFTIEQYDDYSDTMYFEIDENTDVKRLMLLLIKYRPHEFTEESINCFRMWFD